MPALDSSLITKVVRQLSLPPAYAESGVRGSILTAAATSYGFRADVDELTQPTGFDPEAAQLFEALVESAFLVANADGQFDEAEQTAFQHVVLAACGGFVVERQVRALLSDLQDLLVEDGIDKRIDMVARAVTKPDHAREVLRVAALLAEVSGGVSDVERAVMARLAERLGLPEAQLDQAVREAKSALAR
ncbi:MAG: tellurite resistance TerB family protein [Myxococcota bacterium]